MCVCHGGLCVSGCASGRVAEWKCVGVGGGYGVGKDGKGEWGFLRHCCWRYCITDDP